MRADSLTDPALAEFYRELGPEWRPMVELVERLRGKSYAPTTPASTSHSTLVLHTPQNPISIDYHPADREFAMSLWERGRREKRRCGALEGAAEAERLVDAWMVRVGMRRDA